MTNNTDFGSMIAPLTTIVMLGFIVVMVSGMMKGAFSEHHSIHGPERRRLVDAYGSWAVGRAEAVCPEGDVACVESEAQKLLKAYRGEW